MLRVSRKTLVCKGYGQALLVQTDWVRSQSCKYSHMGNSVPFANALVWDESTIPSFIGTAAFSPSDRVTGNSV